MPNDKDIFFYLEDDVNPLELRYECPYCLKEATCLKGCQHFVFSFETVNFEYLHLDKHFRDRSLAVLRSKGYSLDKLPCPLEPWAEDDEGREMPSMDKLIPGLTLKGYRYRAPRGHGSWAHIIGFELSNPG